MPALVPEHPHAHGGRALCTGARAGEGGVGVVLVERVELVLGGGRRAGGGRACTAAYSGTHTHSGSRRRKTRAKTSRIAAQYATLRARCKSESHSAGGAVNGASTRLISFCRPGGGAVS